MKTKTILVSTLLMLTLHGIRAIAQPNIPRQNIPSNISQEVRQSIEALYASDPVARARAAKELDDAGVEARGAIPFLVAMLSDDVLIDPIDEDIRWYTSGYEVILKTSPSLQAARTLVNFGEPVVESVISALRRGDWKTQKRAANILGRIESPRAVAPLMEALKNQNGQVRVEAVRALGDLEDAQSVNAILGVLNDREWEVRREAVDALSEIKDPGSLDAIQDALRDAVWQVREEAADALGEFDDPRSLQVLISAMRDDHPKVREAAADALGDFEDIRALRSLSEALRDPDWEVRTAAANALGEINDRQAVDPLIARIKRSQLACTHQCFRCPGGNPGSQGDYTAEWVFERRQLACPKGGCRSPGRDRRHTGHPRVEWCPRG